jgi:tRNA threonylcarbamoyl adenosine modification protein YeaZ
LKNFLALDTSGKYMSVVAMHSGSVFSTFVPDCTMKHSILIMQAIQETLEKANMQVSDCDFFSAVVGAGSFTGIRIGISVVKGFCLAFGKPALPVTSFDVLAYNALDGKVLCLVDALHDSYYACGYEQGKVVYPPAYLSEQEVLDLAAEGYTLVACTGLPLAEKTAVTLVDPCVGLEKATKALGEMEKFGELSALYVRKSSAEINRGDGK